MEKEDSQNLLNSNTNLDNSKNSKEVLQKYIKGKLTFN